MFAAPITYGDGNVICRDRVSLVECRGQASPPILPISCNLLAACHPLIATNDFACKNLEARIHGAETSRGERFNVVVLRGIGVKGSKGSLKDCFLLVFHRKTREFCWRTGKYSLRYYMGKL